MLPAIEAHTFNQEVLRSNIPVLVSFWAPWCRVCRWVEPLLHNLQLRSASAFKIVSVNADTNLHLASCYKVINIPSLLLFDRGQLVERIDHFGSQAEAQQLLECALDQIARSQLSTG
ncbi:MAG: thiol reductase thioredoxin [Acaryochloris sp. RU_4_1]|nr:thiol reductase thioredoxin [Acaryochloris sp. SU_5_25]NJM64851.1 thiol reductase thioredoxin [Acaryochloris sp. RU_4_1]NJR54491.1 thiol reductase thioredoxin [Acaryochloris sp. CRU_2_0]